MKEQIKNKIDSIIYGIVFDLDTSINKKVSLLDKYFSKYDGIEYNVNILAFRKPKKKDIEDMIIDCLKKNGFEACDIFDNVSKSIASILLDEFINKLTK